MLKEKLSRAVDLINVPHHICDHIFNKRHTLLHRVATGGIVAFVGVCVSKIHVELMIVHYMLDYLGYFMHGLGLVPVVDHVVKNIE